MKKILFLAVVLIMFVVGCEQIINPESNVNKTTELIERVAPVVSDGLIASGVVTGGLVGSITTVLSVIAGSYNNWRKKLIIKNAEGLLSHSQIRLANVTSTTKAIVGAIEKVGEVEVNSTTIGNMTKAKIAEELKAVGLYSVGKAIISGLKT